MDSIIEQFRLGMDRVIPALIPFPAGLILNVGAGNKIIPGSVPLDWPAWNADKDPIPYNPDTVSGIHCYHFLEHYANPISILAEFQRVLQPGGVVNIVVPFYNSSMQAQDLDHKARFCENTWKTLFRNPYYNKYNVKWQFQIGTNLIIGVAERNLCLLTQMVKQITP